jgi:Lrp/AsnC family transcriptional regulator, regulator for asnA, asnC and gidA
VSNQIDDTDYRITRLLQKNGRIPNTEIAKSLGISEATVRNRLQRLIKDECIQIVAVVNPFKLKSGIVGNLRISADNKKLDQVGRELKKLDELWYVAQLAGSSNFDAEYYVKSQNQIGQLIDKVNNIDGMTHVEASLIVRYVKNSWGFGIPES